MSYSLVYAAPVYDQTNGVYTDDFANNSGVPTRSYVNVNTSTGKLQLTNASSQTTFTTPYKTSGYVYTSVILPISVAKWGQITFDATVPDGTTLKVQVYDSGGYIFSDNQLAGNSTGFSSSPIDLSSLSTLIISDTADGDGKIGRLKLKISMTTIDTTVTPTLDNLSINWIVKQGDLTGYSINPGGWPVLSFDQKGTYHTSYKNSNIYPAFKWASAKKNGNDLSNNNLMYNNQIITNTRDNQTMYLLNRDTGEDVSSFPYAGGSGAISTNGTFYAYDVNNDVLAVVDLETGAPKWSYQFSGGHGNAHVALASDGTAYIIYSPSDDDYLIVYAFNPDGSIKWTKTINPNTDRVSASQIALDSDGTILFTTVIYNDDYDALNNGKLYGLDPNDGDVVLEIETGDGNSLRAPIVDNDDTIYVSQYTYTGNFPKKLTAINPDGSTKWTYYFDNNTDRGYYQMGLRDDGVLLGVRVDADYSVFTMEARNVTNGSLLWSENIDGQTFFSDGYNGFYLEEIDYSGDPIEENRWRYYDSAYNLRWTISYSYNYIDGSNGYVLYLMPKPIMDSRGWVYGEILKSYYNPEWESISANQYVQYFALAPWTLTNNTESYSSKKAGQVINFNVDSSMLQTNPLFGGNNQAQVVMDNGDKVALSYGGLDADGNSIWTGSYTLPSDLRCGSHTYTIEAGQTYLQTDITTHFDSAPLESNNTGITTTGTFTAFQCGGGGLPAGYTSAPQSPTSGAFKVIINDGQGSTSSNVVKLNFIAGPDTTRVAIAEDPNFTNAPLLNYQPEMTYELSKGNGAKTIYVKFYTQYGYASKQVIASIILGGAIMPNSSQSDWITPTNYEYITGPSKLGLYQKIIKEPNSNRLYGLPKNQSAIFSLPQVKGLATSNLFNQNLSYGTTNNPEVKRLQDFLIANNYLAQGLNTGNYYRLTQDAVKKFQKANNITPINGTFGSKTREVANDIIK